MGGGFECFYIKMKDAVKTNLGGRLIHEEFNKIYKPNVAPPENKYSIPSIINA